MRTDGSMQGAWVILDFFDVIVHVMRQDARERYDLERSLGRCGAVKAKKSKAGQVKLTAAKPSKKRIRKAGK